MRSLFIYGLVNIALVASAQARTGYPTIYSTPLVKTAEMSCAAEKVMTVLDENGNEITRLCLKEYKDCLMEGACVLEDAQGKRQVISHVRYDEKLERQLFTSSTECLYGLGAGVTVAGQRASTCLDPYFSVAADPKAHRLGDVIFVEKLVGTKLPSGETHDGYLIVRDTNSELAGHGADRFAFFSAFQRDNDAENPFVRLTMENRDYTFEYRNVTGAKAEQVRKARAYPRLNQHLKKGF